MRLGEELLFLGKAWQGVIAEEGETNSVFNWKRALKRVSMVFSINRLWKSASSRNFVERSRHEALNLRSGVRKLLRAVPLSGFCCATPNWLVQASKGPSRPALAAAS